MDDVPEGIIITSVGVSPAKDMTDDINPFPVPRVQCSLLLPFFVIMSRLCAVCSGP